MRIGVYGLGYVGAVTAGCLASQGHRVMGVDVSAAKVEMLNRGEAPIIEPGLAELLRGARGKGLLEATTDSARAVRESDASLICVGTPSTASGGIDLRYVEQVTREIGAAMAGLGRAHAVLFRSTLLPGTTAKLVAEFLPGCEGSVYYFPEFLREGTAVEDFRNPSLTVVGTVDGAQPPEDIGRLFGASAVRMSWAEAELVKYACNAYHAVKVAFANEIGRVGKEAGVDAGRVMETLCGDTRLNISPLYLRPGNPFGGSCLPKDVRALSQYGRRSGVSLPLLENLLASNEQQLKLLLRLVERTEQTEVIILGLSFKAATDDLRESPMVEVAQHLLGRGYRVRVFDPQLNLAKLVGSNKRLIDTRMPHLASLLQGELPEALGQSGVILAAQRCAALRDLEAWVTERHHVIDVNGWPELRGLRCSYEGLCW